MIDCVIYSDLHIRENRIEDFIHVLKEIPKIAESEGVSYIINAGDTFDTRGIINTACLQTVYNEFKKWQDKGLKQTILVGNHDQADKAGLIHPMSVFESFDKWQVIDKPKVSKEKKILFLPYMQKSEMENFLSKENWTGWTGIFHAGILGAKMSSITTDKEGLSIDLLKDFKIIFSGHYHLRHELKNVFYIGSPLQQDHGEADQEKGVIVVRNNKMNFVPIKGTPRFFNIRVTWDNNKRQIEMPKIVPNLNDYAAVTLEGDIEQVSSVTRKDLELEIRAGNIKINRNAKVNVNTRMNIETKDIFDTEGLMKKYLEHIETSLPKDRLMKVGKEILSATL